MAGTERLLYDITEKCTKTRFYILFLDIFANGKQQFLVFERNGHNGQNPLFYGVFVNDSAGLIQHFLP